VKDIIWLFLALIVALVALGAVLAVFAGHFNKMAQTDWLTHLAMKANTEIPRK
jgi:hypothetical protein